VKQRERKSYGRIKEILPPPYLLQDEKESFEAFVRTGIKEAFSSISPIKGHRKDGLALELTDPYLGNRAALNSTAKTKILPTHVHYG